MSKIQLTMDDQVVACRIESVYGGPESQACYGCPLVCTKTPPTDTEEITHYQYEKILSKSIAVASLSKKSGRKKSGKKKKSISAAA